MSKFNMVELLQFTYTINEMKTNKKKNISKFNRVELLQFTNTINEMHKRNDGIYLVTATRKRPWFIRAISTSSTQMSAVHELPENFLKKYLVYVAI